MGEIADMMLDGTLCEGCGEYIDGPEPGYPRLCGGCAADERKREKRKAKKKRQKANRKARSKLDGEET